MDTFLAILGDEIGDAYEGQRLQSVYHEPVHHELEAK